MNIPGAPEGCGFLCPQWMSHYNLFVQYREENNKILSLSYTNDKVTHS